MSDSGSAPTFANGVLTSSFTGDGSTFFSLDEAGPGNGFDWPGAVSVTARVRASAGVGWAKVFVQTGSGWMWHDQGVWDGSVLQNWTDITLTFSGDDVTQVKKFGLQVGGTGAITVDVDFIHVQ